MGIEILIVYIVDLKLYALMFEYMKNIVVKEIFLDFGLHGFA